MGILKVNGSVNIQDLLTLKTGTSAYDTPSIDFGTDARIGYGSTKKTLGIYSSNNIYFRPNNGTLGSSDGIELSTTSLIPTKNNTVALGSSTNKWSNIYATTFTGALSGNATSASAAPWSGITGKPTSYPVKQSRSTTTNYRPLLLHYVAGEYGVNPETAEAQTYYHEDIAACPSTGAIKATTFIGALSGNASTATTLSATLAINKGGTGATTRVGAVNSLFYLGGNLVTTKDQDKPSIWREYGQGFAYFNDDVPNNDDTGVKRPETWMHILNIGPSGHALRTQLGFQAGGADLYIRGGSSSGDNEFGAWYTILTTKSTVTVAQGGTGITSNPSMLVNLASTTADTVFEASPRPGITGTLGVANGGTGATTFTSGAALIGAGTGAVTTRAITNNTTATAVTASTNLITANTLYYHKGNSNIVTVGTISSGKWQGTKVGIAYGGTNATTAKGAEYNIIMNGNTESSTSAITDNTQFVFKLVTPSATDGVLYYRTGDYLWTYIKGKSDSTYLKLAGGTMTGTITSQSITPKASNEYNLGTVAAPWYQIITRRLYLLDGTNTNVNYGRFIVTTQGTTSEQGVATLYVGNANGAKTAGGAYGQVVIYGTEAGYATLRATASATAATTHYLPTTGGTLLNTGNYTTYVPKKDGTGASGTWGISITGNAATATTASAVAWANVSGKPSSYTPAAHTNHATLKITSTAVAQHLTFSRAGANYIDCPDGGGFYFSTTNGTSAAASQFIIQKTAITLKGLIIMPNAYGPLSSRPASGTAGQLYFATS